MSYNDDYYNQPYDDRWNRQPDEDSGWLIAGIFFMVIALIAML